jgi:hypothetical protein
MISSYSACPSGCPAKRCIRRPLNLSRFPKYWRLTPKGNTAAMPRQLALRKSRSWPRTSIVVMQQFGRSRSKSGHIGPTLKATLMTHLRRVDRPPSCQLSELKLPCGRVTVVGQSGRFRRQSGPSGRRPNKPPCLTILSNTPRSLSVGSHISRVVGRCRHDE